MKQQGDSHHVHSIAQAKDDRDQDEGDPSRGEGAEEGTTN
jgi:hypothetical protein